MTDQQLRLGATFHDGATPAIRKLKSEMAGVKVMPGMTAANEWMGNFTTKASDFVKSGGGVEGVFSAMGIAGLTTAASMASLVGHFKALSEHVLTIKELGREVGLTTNQLNQFVQAGQKFGVGAEAIEGAIDAFKSQIPQFITGTGNLFNELAQRAPNLVKALKLEDTEHQLKSIFEYLGQAKLQANPQQQKQMAELFFPGHGAEIEKLFADGPKAFGEEVERMKKSLPDITKEMEQQAKQLREATGEFNRTIEGFELGVGPKVLGTMTAIVKELQQFIDALNGHDASKEAPKPGEKPKEKSWGEWLGDKARDGYAAEQRGEKGFWNWYQEWSGKQPQLNYDSLRHKSSYGGGSGGAKLWDASYEDSDSAPTGSASQMLTEGVKQGVLAAYRELQAEASAGGFQNASFGGGGGVGGGGGSWHGRALGVGSGSGIGHTASQEQRAAFIRAYAASIGIDPETALRVAQSEGFYKYTGDGGTSFGDFQMHVGGGLGDRLRQMGIDPTDPNQWQKADKVALDIARQEGWGAWHGAANVGIGRTQGIGVAPDGTALDAYNKKQWPAPGAMPNVAGGASYPGHITGQLKIGDESYRFGSGGVRGASSIPFGDYPITPNAIGAWGRANGAIGINNDHIYDKALGRMRDGIEMHIGHSLNLITEGCLAFDRAQFPQLKARINEMIARTGHAYLHVGKDGARITPELSPAKPMPSLNPPQPDAPTASRGGDGSHHKLDIHIKDTVGAVRSASLRSTGEGMRTSLNRWPAMTEPSAVG